MVEGRGPNIGGAVLAIVLLVYPLAVYFLIDTFGPVSLGLLLILILIPRLVFILKSPVTAAAIIFGMMICYIAFLNFFDSVFALKLYPTLISLGLLGISGVTLIRPPSMIERLARRLGMPISERGVRYTWFLTLYWCVFFAINALVSGLIAAYGTIGEWTFYNGFLSYIIIGILFAAEFVFRHFYKRHGTTRVNFDKM
jgi:uncharacterized membrane protein